MLDARLGVMFSVPKIMSYRTVADLIFTTHWLRILI